MPPAPCQGAPRIRGIFLTFMGIVRIMKKQKKLTQAQKDLLRGLKIFRVDEECIIVIMLMTQKAFQTEMMIDYMISHEKATQEELLSKAMEISKLKGKSH